MRLLARLIRQIHPTKSLPEAEIIFFCTDNISVLALYSGDRKDSYRRKLGDEHGYIFGKMQQSGFNEEIERSITENEALARQSLIGHLRSLYRFLVRPLSYLEIHPNTPQHLLRYGGKGGFIRKLKKNTG